jgi:hypothetical protein
MGLLPIAYIYSSTTISHKVTMSVRKSVQETALKTAAKLHRADP